MSEGKFCITRQCDLEGIFYVELETGGWDYTSPGMLAGKSYPGEGCHADPRDAAKALIAVRDAWQADRNAHLYPPGTPETEDDQRVILVSIGSTGGGLVSHSPEEMTDEAILAWGESTYANMPKCDKCGDLIDGDPVRLTDDPELGNFCSSRCAEKVWEQYERENESVVIEHKDDWMWWDDDRKVWTDDAAEWTEYTRIEAESIVVASIPDGMVVSLDDATESWERVYMTDMPDPPTPL